MLKSQDEDAYHSPPYGVSEVAELGWAAGLLPLASGAGGILLGEVDEVGGKDEGQHPDVHRGYQLLLPTNIHVVHLIYCYPVVT